MLMDIALASWGRRQSAESTLDWQKSFANQSSLNLAISLIGGPVKLGWCCTLQLLFVRGRSTSLLIRMIAEWQGGWPSIIMFMAGLADWVLSPPMPLSGYNLDCHQKGLTLGPGNWLTFPAPRAGDNILWRLEMIKYKSELPYPAP